MFTTLSVVLPIFALILVGYLCRLGGVLGPYATREINRLVVYLALPALLFDLVAHASWETLYQPGVIGAFGLSCIIVFVGAVAWGRRRGRPLADAALDGLNAAYANVGFMGIPLCAAAFGPPSLAAATLTIVLTACVLFAVAIVLVEVGVQTERRPWAVAWRVMRALARNPLLLAPLAGAVVDGSGVVLPDAFERFIDLLGAAASPCALIALGLFLADRRGQDTRRTDGVALMVWAKLVVHPMLTWMLAHLVFGLAPMQTAAVTLLAALPTGTGPFMLAELYRRDAASTSRAILVSTLLSVVTVAGLLWVLARTLP